MAEIAASAVATLPGKITTVAAAHSVTLSSSFTVDNWWEWDAEDNRSFPALGLRWIRTTTGDGKRYAGVRDAEHEIVLMYAYKSTSMTAIADHMMCIPEAMLLWLDVFPTSSVSAGKTISQIAPPDGQGITIEHDVESVHVDRDGESPTYLWVARLELAVRARDAI